MSSNSLRPGWNRQGFQPPPPADKNNYVESSETTKQNTTTRSNPPSKGRSLADLARGAPARPAIKAPRYTREKLLSLRPALDEPPEAIRLLIDEIKSEEPKDPVCWDTFDADEIWGKRKIEQRPRRESSFGTSSRWQRGVALPAATPRTQQKDAETPDELWDDPQSEEKNNVDVFDFDQMAENSRKLEEEMRGGTGGSSVRSRSSSTDEPATNENKVDLNRPLVKLGMTIRSGSGDDVNVFEDFDEPAAAPVLRAANEDQSASSRLMAMIGVQKEESPTPISTQGSEDEAKFISLPAAAADTTVEAKTPPVDSTAAPAVVVPSLSWGLPGSTEPSATSIPLNPWGGLGAALPLPTQLAEQQRLAEEKKRAALEEQERLRRREQERLIKEQQQREAQVELVLMERISNILEASWGRADIRSILSTLHAEDARVISLLSSVDALRALLFRHARRVAVRPDPSLGAEIVILLMTNAQWRASEQEVPVPVRPKTQELPPVNPALPWFYSDPSKNIQGPFRGQEMRQWLEAGYFKGDLPISQNPKGPFLSLSLFFPNLAEAFKTAGYSDEEAEAAERREAEMREIKLRQKREAERMEAERREAERREAERKEEERRQAEIREAQKQAATKAPLEPRKAQNGGDSASAAKLKMMLGLGGSSTGEAKTLSKSQSEEDLYPQPTKPESYPQPAASSKPTQRTSLQSQANATKEKPAWGGASQPAARKSMSEIQQEEARAAAAAAMNRPTGNSNGWANVAAARSTSLNTSWNAKQSRPVANPTPRQPSRAMSMQTQGAQRMQPMRSQSVTETPTEAFGAKMSPAMEQWAKDQMKRINGTDDLTLIAFCMTLEDPEEIRQYLSAYLGPGAQVNGFATEFIARKNDDWESTARKGRKKKSNR